MTDRRKPRHLKRICGDVDRDLAERWADYVKVHGVGQAVFLEAAIESYLNTRERDRINPRHDSAHEE